MPKIKILPITFPFLFLLTYSMPPKTLICLALSVLCHEAGHIFAALFCKSPVKKIVFSPLGITVQRSASCASYKADIFIYLAGPFCSALTAVAALLFDNHLLFSLSLALGVLNLLPVKIFDGGKALYALLCMTCPIYADKIIKILSGCVLFVLWSFSVYLLLKVGENLSLFILCFYLFFAVFI